MTPLRALGAGLVAGAAGTLAMDVAQFLRQPGQRGASGFVHWELSSGLSSWEDAPAPAQVGKRLVEGLSQRPLPPRHAALVNNVTHWAYGMLGGAQYGLVVGSLRRSRIVYGIPFGVAVWTSSYIVLPLMKLYKPIWEYDVATLAEDLGGHLVYGLTTAATFRALAG